MRFGCLTHCVIFVLVCCGLNVLYLIWGLVPALFGLVLYIFVFMCMPKSFTLKGQIKELEARGKKLEAKGKELRLNPEIGRLLDAYADAYIEGKHIPEPNLEGVREELKKEFFDNYIRLSHYQDTGDENYLVFRWRIQESEGYSSRIVPDETVDSSYTDNWHMMLTDNPNYQEMSLEERLIAVLK